MSSPSSGTESTCSTPASTSSLGSQTYRESRFSPPIHLTSARCEGLKSAHVPELAFEERRVAKEYAGRSGGLRLVSVWRDTSDSGEQFQGFSGFVALPPGAVQDKNIDTGLLTLAHCPARGLNAIRISPVISYENDGLSEKLHLSEIGVRDFRWTRDDLNQECEKSLEESLP